MYWESRVAYRRNYLMVMGNMSLSYTREWKVRSVLGVLLALAVMPISQAAAASYFNKSSWTGVAIEGVDPVAYFTERKPVKGSGKFSLKWKGATWRFSSAENLERFKASPEKYEPQYGGFCAYAVSEGYTASIDPEAWSIVDGKLYLNYSKSVKQLWSQDIPGRIRKGDRNWLGLKTKLLN